MGNRYNEISPCGVFCGACPSFNKSCLGCASEDINQKRKSKWSCKIRQCCYDNMKIDYCGNCPKFPCDRINTKLIKSHQGDHRFKYRHEIPDNMEKMKLFGVDEFIKMKKKDYACKHCDGYAYFYHYKCNKCGKDIIN